MLWLAIHDRVVLAVVVPVGDAVRVGFFVHEKERERDGDTEAERVRLLEMVCDKELWEEDSEDVAVAEPEGEAVSEREDDAVVVLEGDDAEREQERESVVEKENDTVWDPLRLIVGVRLTESEAEAVEDWDEVWLPDKLLLTDADGLLLYVNEALQVLVLDSLGDALLDIEFVKDRVVRLPEDVPEKDLVLLLVRVNVQVSSEDLDLLRVLVRLHDPVGESVCVCVNVSVALSDVLFEIVLWVKDGDSVSECEPPAVFDFVPLLVCECDCDVLGVFDSDADRVTLQLDVEVEDGVGDCDGLTDTDPEEVRDDAGEQDSDAVELEVKLPVSLEEHVPVEVLVRLLDNDSVLVPVRVQDIVELLVYDKDPATDHVGDSVRVDDMLRVDDKDLLILEPEALGLTVLKDRVHVLVRLMTGVHENVLVEGVSDTDRVVVGEQDSVGEMLSVVVIEHVTDVDHERDLVLLIDVEGVVVSDVEDEDDADIVQLPVPVAVLDSL